MHGEGDNTGCVSYLLARELDKRFVEVGIGIQIFFGCFNGKAFAKSPSEIVLKPLNEFLIVFHLTIENPRFDVICRLEEDIKGKPWIFLQIFMKKDLARLTFKQLPFFRQGMLIFEKSGHPLRLSNRSYRCDLNIRRQCKETKEKQINKQLLERNFSRYAENFSLDKDTGDKVFKRIMGENFSA